MPIVRVNNKNDAELNSKSGCLLPRCKRNKRNDAVLQNPLLVNEDPYGEGWLFEMEPTSPTSWQSDAEELVSGEAIAEWAAAEIERFREEAPSA